MPTEILVATPDPAFGEVLRASLAEDGGYTVNLVQTAGEVLRISASHPFALAILDAELDDEPFVPLAFGLMAQLPDLRLIVIPPENNPQHPALTGLTPHGYLLRPYYLPDLLDTIASLLASRSTRKAEEKLAPLVVESSVQTAGMSWAEDPRLAEQQISRMLLETDAQAALIAFEGKVWASAGKLGAGAVQEAAQDLGRFWKKELSTNLVRYSRFKATGGEHLIYATRLLDELVLALIYDASDSLARANRQARQMASALSSQALALELSKKKPIQESPADIEFPGEEEFAEDDLEGEGPEIDLAALLAEMPPPDPDRESLLASSEWVHESNEGHEEALPELSESVQGEETGEGFVFPWEVAETASAPTNGKNGSTAEQPASEGDSQEWFAIFRAEVDKDQAEAGEEISKGEEMGFEEHDPISGLRAEAAQADEEAQPLVPGDPLERAAPAFGDLVYTCILLPNRPENYLSGELAGQMGLWVPQLCLAFGWRLEGLTVRPDYLQLSVRLSPGMSPGNIIRILRQRISEKIYNQFPAMKTKEGSEDFWAPGYLVVRGPQPPQTQQLRNFIQQTRQRQGYSES